MGKFDLDNLLSELGVPSPDAPKEPSPGPRAAAPAAAHLTSALMHACEPVQDGLHGATLTVHRPRTRRRVVPG